MTRIDKSTFICKKCSKKFDVDTYHSVNVTLNPELRDKVLSGEIYKFICPHCHHINYILYPFVYVDMTHKFMIYQGSLVSLIRINNDINNGLINDFSKLFSDFLHLGVDSYVELCSKIIMLENNIDYRVGTFYSILLETQYQKIIDSKNNTNVDNAIVCDSYFVENNGNIVVVIDLLINDGKNTHHTTGEIFDRDIYNEIYEKYYKKTTETFNFCFNRDIAKKMLYLDSEDIESLKNIKVEVLAVVKENGEELLTITKGYNEGLFSVDDYICLKIKDILEKVRITDIFNMDLYSLPIFNIIDVAYKLEQVELETSLDSNYELVNAELKIMVNEYNKKGLDYELVLKSNVILGALCRINPNNNSIETKLLTKFDEADNSTYLAVYLEQGDLTNEYTSRFIYNFDDVIRLVLNNIDLYNGIVINPESDNVILKNNTLINYSIEKILCNEKSMKQLLHKLTYKEILYLGDFTYNVISKVYEKITTITKIAEELHTSLDDINHSLSTGYNKLKEIVLNKYLNTKL